MPSTTDAPAHQRSLGDQDRPNHAVCWGPDNRAGRPDRHGHGQSDHSKRIAVTPANPFGQRPPGRSGQRRSAGDRAEPARPGWPGRSAQLAGQ
jgi:hypothetical protein